MLDLLGGFVAELRASGIPVSLTETIDAAQAVGHVPLDDRDGFKYALAATLVKDASHWAAFETVFDVYFSTRGRARSMADEFVGEGSVSGQDGEDGSRGEGQNDGGGMDGLSPEELAEMLYRALLNADADMLRGLAGEAVTRFAGMEPGRPVGGTYYLYRVLRRLELEGVLERLLEAAQDTSDESRTDLQERLQREEFQMRIDKLKAEIEAEIRRRLVEDRGSEAMARTLRRPLPEDIDFMHATRDELTALRRAVQPLTRKLAVKLARKRRHKRKGALDFRNTIRHSLSYGGVPAEPKFKHPRPHKPEMFVIADISGSVAAFARFTLQLVYAISTQFSRVRSFVFIDGIDEVTRLLEGTEDIGAAVHRVNTEADVIWVDGHSDYGHAFNVFWERWGKEISAKTSVIILGDARNNYHASSSWVISEIAKRARHVYWLNPEPKSYWNTGDSILSEYAPHTDGTFECRNLRQLSHFVEQLD